MTMLALVTCGLYLLALVDVVTGVGRLRRLDAAPVPPPVRWPPVSIVIPARNEAPQIGPALRSILASDYPDVEVIVVDDRSTDDTSAIAVAIAREHPRLTVVAVDQLPDGWMGKSHALALGVQRAAGDLLLFTDADVLHAPDALRRAVAILEADRLDHLAVTPTVLTRSWALRCLVATFGLLFTLHTRPWRVPDARSRAHIGIGAFNLLRASTYAAIGTHARIRSAPDDDLQLGKAVKMDGHRQAMAVAGDRVQVEWYPGVRALIDGLMKNAFAGLGYRVSAVVGAVLVLLAVTVWPVVALVASRGSTQAANLAVVVSAAALFVVHTRLMGGRGTEVVAAPAASLVFCWILVRAAWLALSTGGIEWRGRHYPLAALRAGRLRGPNTKGRPGQGAPA